MNNKELINRYILEGVQNGQLDSEMSLLILKELNKNKEVENSDIAIVGIACKFPYADNANEYWENLKNGVEVIGDFPENRAKDMGKAIDLKAGWLQEISGFDAGFFRISPKEAITMHPAQRLFLETAWEALEDSGYCNKEINKAPVGVYVGIDHTYQMEYNKMTDQQDLLSMTGTMTSVLASRISYVLNLHGPNLVVDTACSSGLVTTHLACKAIKNKECNMAIAGGIHLLRQIDAKFDGVESTNGKLSSFDKNSKGTVWGEGIGFVILKPLSEALKDKDNIYAVIKGSSINNDGATNGITSPNSETQSEAIVSAWEDAGINPETISYIEAHATGTVLGDPIEVKGIKMAFDKYTDKKQFCGIGSVKPNIGHGVSAAAMSSLLKVVLSLKNKQLAPNINFSEPNPFIQFHNSPLYVNDKLRDWETNGFPRRAGVSSFGFGRTNCHMVVEEAPDLNIDKSSQVREDKGYIFTLSAKSENALKEYIKKYKAFTDNIEEFDLESICFTANAGRMDFNHRLVMILKDKDDFIDKIKNLDFDNLKGENVYYSFHKVVPDTVKEVLEGEITQKEKRELSEEAFKKMVKLDTLNGAQYYDLAREVCELYLKGADIEWLEFYRNKPCQRISLPTYPFEHKHYWIKPKVEEGISIYEKQIDHPLIDKCIANTVNGEVYVTQFMVDRQWILTEHLIMDHNVVPGTTYMEMATIAGKRLCKGSNIELKDVILLSPLIVEKDEIKEVHTIITKENGYFSFKIASKINDDEDHWVIHVEGKLFNNNNKIKVVDLKKLKEDFNINESTLELSNEMGGFKFGPRWRNISNIVFKDKEIFTKIQLADEFKEDIKQFVIHPALLDNAVNLAVERLIQNIQEGMYLPLSYKSFKIFGSMPAKFYSHQKITSQLEKGFETISSNISLINEDGEVFMEIEGCSLKKVEKNIFKGDDAINTKQYHTIGWRQQNIMETKPRVQNETILVINDDAEIANKTIENLQGQGSRVINVSFGDSFKKIGECRYEIDNKEESYNKLINDIDLNRLSKIIHMSSILNEEDINSLEGLEHEKNKGVYSLFSLSKALISKKITKPIDLILVSNYVNEVTELETRINPQSASLFALGKVITNENGKLVCRCIDIEDDTTEDELIKEFSAKESIYKVAYRNKVRFVEEFKEVDINELKDEKAEIRDGGVYLITGGTGGIGLEVSRYLSSKNKVNLVLVNRSALPDRDKWDEIIETENNSAVSNKLKAIKELENTGSKVHLYSADITSMKDMEDVIKDINLNVGRINGVVHSAGIAGEGIILKKDLEKAKSVMAPKINGTWVLDKVTAKDKPEFFIMFSSILSIIGSMGQSDYAAANAYMDSFAAYRRRRLGKTATINWTVWSETGMALSYNSDELRGLFKAVKNNHGMQAVDNVLNKAVTRVAVGELDYDRIKYTDGEIGINLSEQLKQKVEKAINCKNLNSANNEETVDVKINSKDEVTEYEVIVAGIWANILGLDEINITDNFNELGGDSIIASQLLKAMDKRFPGSLDISDIFSYPTVKQMAAVIEKLTTDDKEENEKNEEGDKEISIEEEMDIIFDRLTKGEISTEEADELMLKLHGVSF